MKYVSWNHLAEPRGAGYPGSWGKSDADVETRSWVSWPMWNGQCWNSEGIDDFEI